MEKPSSAQPAQVCNIPEPLNLTKPVRKSVPSDETMPALANSRCSATTSFCL